MATRGGMVKKTPMNEYANQKNGLQADKSSWKDGDESRARQVTHNTEDVF